MDLAVLANHIAGGPECDVGVVVLAPARLGDTAADKKDIGIAGKLRQKLCGLALRDGFGVLGKRRYGVRRVEALWENDELGAVGYGFGDLLLNLKKIDGLVGGDSELDKSDLESLGEGHGGFDVRLMMKD